MFYEIKYIGIKRISTKRFFQNSKYIADIIHYLVQVPR